MSTQLHNLHNPFWEYSLQVYQHPQVQACCLALQNDCALDVNVLLYAAWLASLNQEFTKEHLAQIEGEVGPWRSRVIQPLRELRSQLRDFGPALTLREELKSLELRAEQEQQDAMYRCHCGAGPMPARNAPLHHNLAQVAVGSAASREHLQSLLAKLASSLVSPTGRGL